MAIWAEKDADELCFEITSGEEVLSSVATLVLLHHFNELAIDCLLVVHIVLHDLAFRVSQLSEFISISHDLFELLLNFDAATA